MSDELNDMIQGFVDESHEAFDAIESDLLTIESNPDDLSIINGIFRVMHTIKGTAGFLGLDDINRLSHKLESIFDSIRREEQVITSDLMDTILPAIDLLKLMVFELVEENQSDYDLVNTLETLEQVTNPFRSEESVIKQEPPVIRTEPVREEPPEVEPPADAEEIYIDPEVQKEFVIEAEEHLETIESNLLCLEKHPKDENSINEVFRAIHSIKGTSDYVNLKKITKLSHKLETIFDQIRKGTREYDNELADIVLKGVDLLRTLVFMLKMDDTSTVIQIDGILGLLNDLIETPKAAGPGSKAPEPTPPPQKEWVEEPPLSKTLKAFKNVSSQQMLVIRNLSAGFFTGELSAEDLMVLHRSLKTLENSANNVGELKVATMTAEMDDIVLSVLAEEKGQAEMGPIFVNYVDNLIEEIGAILREEAAEEEEEIPEPVSYERTPLTEEPVEGEKSLQPISKIDPTAPQGAQKGKAAPAGGTSEIKTMRVDSDRLDTFMNLIAELIIARNSYNHTLGDLSDHSVPPSVISSLRSVESAFNRISEDLQNTLMEMRLVAVKSVFQKIPRIVRDISRKRNKKMQLQMIGENTEIDKSIIELIGDPLVHIVRNSCDHGIETPEERVRAGKPEVGNIILKASHLGNVIAIDIIDDGAGIDTDRVLKKAVEKGIVSPEKAETLDKKTINNFIFHAGFSTASEITDISGRGVGMDVVMTNINKIHGSVEVDSDKGHGTQIRLLLPLTLAVVDALIVVDQNQKFAIPLDAVKETIEIRESDLQLLNQKEAINLRGNIIGVSRLSRLLDLEEIEGKPDRILSIVFLETGNRVIGIVIDDLLNQQEIVVKPLQSYLTKIPGIGGSTILGSGEIILILEPTELIDLAAL